MKIWKYEDATKVAYENIKETFIFFKLKIKSKKTKRN